MAPRPAEIARTLAAGRIPGHLHLPWRTDPLCVRHAIDRSGNLLLLAKVDGQLAQALIDPDYGDGSAVVLAVEDAPPLPGSPSLGTVWLGGWTRPLTGVEAYAARMDFAVVNPTGDLFDVGRGFVLHEIEVAEVRLEIDQMTVEIEPEDFAAAEPDPLHEMEQDLLMDLADHHVPEISAMLTCFRGEEPDEPRAVRLDRYGFVVATGPVDEPRYARLNFSRPVTDHADLARVMHPVLCTRCGGGRPAR